LVANLEIVRKMKGDELVRLARVLSIPLTERKVKRDWLVKDIVRELSERRGAVEEQKIAELHEPALRLSNMTKRFGKKVAVRSLNLNVHPGEIVGLVGPNGAGKTTSLRVLTGIIKPTRGRISVNGFDMAKNPVMAKERIGYIPERPTCYPSLKVREYLTFMARVYNVPQEDALIRMREFVDMFQLDEYLDTYIGTLSKGNLQRTLVVGIFIREPPFVLAFDEPIYGLDPRGAWNLKVHLRRLRDSGSAILVSTHILEVAEGLCDRFVIMNEADVVGRGTLSNLLEENPGTSSLEEVFLSLTGGIPEE
jgi:ABC-2 type transport system ATP-binding protein